MDKHWLLNPTVDNSLSNALSGHSNWPMQPVQNAFLFKQSKHTEYASWSLGSFKIQCYSTQQALMGEPNNFLNFKFLSVGLLKGKYELILTEIKNS